METVKLCGFPPNFDSTPTACESPATNRAISSSTPCIRTAGLCCCGRWKASTMISSTHLKPTGSRSFPCRIEKPCEVYARYEHPDLPDQEPPAGHWRSGQCPER